MDQTETKKSFKDTLNLPHTDFPIRGDSATTDKELLARWQKDDLYKATFESNAGNKKFILHDGPPYANGNIHLGHAYNKILKDILCKAFRMSGYNVPVTPGWDCHGLPIEKKVTEEHPNLPPQELKAKCREYAQKWIDIQRSQFRSLGVLMDWDNPYITMSASYEAATVRALGVLVKKQFIERKNKTVPWCMYDATVLATAEIEYKDRKDPSIYVLFELEQSGAKKLFKDINAPINLLIWTTTPWTLPLNQAVLAKKDADYVLAEVNGKYILVGAQVAPKLAQLMSMDFKVIANINGQVLEGLKARHPFIERIVPIIFDDSVGTHEGTAFVHCAPGCGPIDYEIGVKHGLPIYSPITADGKYDADIEPKELLGLSVTDGQIWVIKKLAGTGSLLFKNSINHSYPHCWRCHNGLIFRATPQWFFNLEKEGVKTHALSAIEKINFTPESGRNFLRATVENRWEWCLSRQRIWGVPIPAIICQNCDTDYLTPELIEKVALGIETHGIEYWDMVSIKELAGDLKCSKCKSSDFKKEFDILDVWFDAGVSHYAVLLNNKNLAFPADIYLEGIDQHRGWFQSSLLTSLVLESEPCMKGIMTHGYTVDAKGQKMSKSLGNVVVPEDIIKQLGTDGLRLWVASIGHSSDPIVSEALLQNIGTVYRKIRNTCRFLLSNIYDFDIKKDGIKLHELQELDKYAYNYILELNQILIAKYTSGDFTAVFHALADYCSVELSAFYLDIVKDRLYVEKADGHARRSAQTVLWHILDTLTRLMAPIVSFTSELVSDHYQLDKNKSIHLQSFGNPEVLLTKEEFKTQKAQWNIIKDIRDSVLKAIEIKREQGDIKHSLEAAVALYIDFSNKKMAASKTLFERLSKDNKLQSFFKELFIVSDFKLANSSVDLNETANSAVFVKIEKAQGQKCPRCWQWQVTNNKDGLCARCQAIVGEY